MREIDFSKLATQQEQPWYAKLFSQMGPVTAGFVAMLAFLLMFVYNSLTLANNKLDGLHNRSERHEQIVDQIRQQTIEQVYLLRSICVEVAKSDVARLRCTQSGGFR